MPHQSQRPGARQLQALVRRQPRGHEGAALSASAAVFHGFMGMQTVANETFTADLDISVLEETEAKDAFDSRARGRKEHRE